jgi:rhodanese-related sulfurtransferase
MTSRPANIKNNIDHPILKKLPAEIRREILHRAELKTFSAGQEICRQDDPGDGFFMIKSGLVRVYRKTKENLKTELAVLGPGESFGEMALLTGAPRAASVEVVKDVQLISLSKEQFDRILKKYPVMALTLIQQMVTWVIDNDQIIEREHRRQYRPPKLSVFDFVVIIFLSCLCAVIFNQSNPNGIPLFPKIVLNENISVVIPEAAYAASQNGGPRFVDARPADFYEIEHIAGAVNIPLSVFDIMYMVGLSDTEKTREIIVYGRTISRRYDMRVANKLFLRGHKNVRILQGGVSGWKKKGYPVLP